ncbi:ROK family transcriptional regulator [Aestuariimicrobium sp. T2.26MG-19.2B]|uniref:ROK family transcriptional regulator n=1 Tax=Aestuariimicrobium sp. T2.26MG-19.2B TaxID=3040679 RepID=UPI0024776532|nr:ROK family transcriptional regulator [Aestuariimicrobium sp. T2.26MG-19.2B]CAI9411209.1 Protein mlc [Aestuariimicrobium sp. T2.26MG-19.2B]
MPGQPKHARRKPGSQPALRHQNTQRVVETLAQRGPTTQAKLSRLTGLSTGTISNIVRELSAAARVTTTPVIDSGRRAMEIALRADARVCVGADLSEGRLRLVLARTDHEVLRSVDVPLTATTPSGQLQQLRRQADDLLDDLGITVDDVIGAVIGLPPATHAFSGDDRLSTWDDIDPSPLAEVTFSYECRFEPAAALAAFAQISWGPYASSSSVAHLTLGVEPVVGLVVDNRLVSGRVGAAGRIAHLQVVPRGEICRCGNRGCLQTVASSAVVAGLVARARRLPSLTDAGVVALAQERDLPALRVLEDVGEAIGQALAAVCTVVNPATVVIGGTLAEAGAPLFDPVQRAFVRHVIPAVAQTTVITRCQLGSTAAALGAAALVARTEALRLQ